MKRILLFAVIALVGFAACKKRETTISRTVTVSYPKVIIENGQFYSFPVGGGPLPSANTIKATAYDSFYNKAVDVVVDASQVNPLMPGLYVITVSARNENGHVGADYVYVAVTDVNDTMDLSGVYLRSLGGFPVFSYPSFVVKRANGLYTMSNVGAMDTGTSAKLVTPAVFAVTSDTTISLGLQPTALGTITSTYGMLSLTPGDTTISYTINGNKNFDETVRTLKKQ